MAQYKNLSDGSSNGFVLLYLKDGVLYPVGLTEEQAAVMDVAVMAPFQFDSVDVLMDQPLRGSITKQANNEKRN